MFFIFLFFRKMLSYHAGNAQKQHKKFDNKKYVAKAENKSANKYISEIA